LLPGLDGDYFTQKIALLPNDCGVFQNFWVHLRFEAASPCIFTRGLGPLALPIRHGEGKVFATDRDFLDALERAHCVACRYVDSQTFVPTMRFPDNPNGSLNAIAGLCDPTGRIFGLMPHPEAYLFPENHPQWQRQRLSGELSARHILGAGGSEQGLGLQIFQNAVRYLQA
ncbi:MAG: phosphoribosylformylglycinamidine synthase subunit PurQ, partial [Lentisphaerae bacterium]|nr:phosphoribosylformylglycinamidine synthase subunit PurQ [Lentisphaerota bacterium]